MTDTIRTAIVVGNPKPRSRTFAAAHLLVEQLTGSAPDIALDLADLGPGLLDWADPTVTTAVESIKSVDLAVVASPTFKATYSGLLKLFLDRFSSDALNGVVAVPLMLGAGPSHALAPEVSLKPVLVEIGATTPTRALYVIDSAAADPATFAPWLQLARLQLAASLGRQLERS